MEHFDPDHDNDIEGDMGGRDLHDGRKRYSMAALDTQRDVTVKAVNGKGFQTEVGDWLNVSKFARPEACPMPNAGDRVRVVVDKAGFIRRISGLTGGIGNSWTPAAETAPTLAIVAPIVADPSPAEPPAFVGRIEQDARGVVITRMNVMTTATAILSSGGRATSAAEVLVLSAHLEAWATR